MKANADKTSRLQIGVGMRCSVGTVFHDPFEMQKSPMVDIVDPDGLVRSQALETLDDAFRITLNGAETADAPQGDTNSLNELAA